MYKIRVILDTKEDVIRTLSIDENCNLEQLHYTITNVFAFDGQEMASFYRSDEEWNQGEEIPLFNMSEIGVGISMATCILKETLKFKNDKLIYVYDFLKMWSFYIELVDHTDEKVTEAKVILSIGETPNKAPEKEFKADNDFNDDQDSNYLEFENIDDIDFDTY